jgi:hypothetical protein
MDTTIKPPASHPHVVVLCLTQDEHANFLRLNRDHDDVRVLDEVTEDEVVTLYVGCADGEIAYKIEDAWG